MPEHAEESTDISKIIKRKEHQPEKNTQRTFQRIEKKCQKRKPLSVYTHHICSTGISASEIADIVSAAVLCENNGKVHAPEKIGHYYTYCKPEPEARIFYGKRKNAVYQKLFHHLPPI